MPRVIRALIATAFSFAILVPGLPAQQVPQAQDPTNPPPPQTLTKDQRKAQKDKARKTLKELDSQYKQWLDRKSTRLNSSHVVTSRMPSSA